MNIEKIISWFSRFRDVILAFLFIAAILGLIAIVQAVYAFSHSNEIDLEKLLHVALPITVLAMELYMINKMAGESRERAETIHHFKELATQTKRNQYLVAIAKAITNTKNNAIFTTASMEVSSQSYSQKLILEAVTAREAQGAYSHRGLVAKRLEALPGAIELTLKTNVVLRMSNAIALSRLRFFVNDAEDCILGVAEGQPDLSSEAKKTTQSTRLSSRMLGDALRRQFESLWESSSEVGAYLDELIDAASPAVQRSTVESWFVSLKVEREILVAHLEEISPKFKALDASGIPVV